jgi:hypothetical protein
MSISTEMNLRTDICFDQLRAVDMTACIEYYSDVNVVFRKTTLIFIELAYPSFESSHKSLHVPPPQLIYLSFSKPISKKLSLI